MGVQTDHTSSNLPVNKAAGMNLSKQCFRSVKHVKNDKASTEFVLGDALFFPVNAMKEDVTMMK